MDFMNDLRRRGIGVGGGVKYAVVGHNTTYNEVGTYAISIDTINFKPIQVLIYIKINGDYYYSGDRPEVISYYECLSSGDIITRNTARQRIIDAYQLDLSISSLTFTNNGADLEITFSKTGSDSSQELRTFTVYDIVFIG